MLPVAWRFFLQFENPGSTETLPIQLEARIGEYLSLTMQLIFAFGLAFSTARGDNAFGTGGGWSPPRPSPKKRRWAILGVFVFAALFTPPDPLSQISLAVPMILLYEISVRAARYIERRTEGRSP